VYCNECVLKFRAHAAVCVEACCSAFLPTVCVSQCVCCSVCVVMCVTVCVAVCASELVHSSCVCVFKCGRGSGCCSTRAVYVLRCVLHSVPHTMLQRVEQCVA